MEGFDAKRTVVVLNLPSYIDEEEVTIHFQTAKHGGGDVAEIKFDQDGSHGIIALVIFHAHEGLKLHYKDILQHEKISEGRLTTDALVSATTEFADILSEGPSSRTSLLIPDERPLLKISNSVLSLTRLMVIFISLLQKRSRHREFSEGFLNGISITVQAICDCFKVKKRASCSARFNALFDLFCRELNCSYTLSQSNPSSIVIQFWLQYIGVFCNVSQRLITLRFKDLFPQKMIHNIPHFSLKAHLHEQFLCDNFL